MDEQQWEQERAKLDELLLDWSTKLDGEIRGEQEGTELEGELPDPSPIRERNN